MEGGLTQKPVNQSRSYQLSLVTLWDLQHVLCSVWLCSCIEKKNGRLFSQIMWEEMHKSLRTTATKVYKHNGSKKFQHRTAHHTQHAAKSCADKGCYVILLFPKGGFCSWKGWAVPARFSPLTVDPPASDGWLTAPKESPCPPDIPRPPSPPVTPIPPPPPNPRLPPVNRYITIKTPIYTLIHYKF